MADFELVMPKMGESIMEATILKWLKKEGDFVEEDETILEIATDKVDTEIPSPVAGRVSKLLYKEEDVVAVGNTVAIISVEKEEDKTYNYPKEKPPTQMEPKPEPAIVAPTPPPSPVSPDHKPSGNGKQKASAGQRKFPPVSNGRFYSPLVRKIAQEEGMTFAQLETVPGTGLNGRVTKRDILSYIEQRSIGQVLPANFEEPIVQKAESRQISEEGNVPVSGADEIIEMDRTRRLIADHMVMSKKTSAHVTSFVEADVTDIVKWRDKVKDEFFQHHGTKLTFTPIFIDAVVKAIGEFPRINASVKGDQIIVKRNINIGMATALPNGNLIVPVIKNADSFNIVGLARQVGILADKARAGELHPDEVADGTFTVTNVGTFGNVMGTPIINQPQVAILATGAIRKKPAVVETEYGDLIAVRHMVFLSLSYDHRIVDGYLGGSFLRKVADFLEQFGRDALV